MLRVTTNSTLYTYQKNLLKNSNQLYSAMNAMMSGRNFDSYSADPAAATRAFRIHSSLNATNAQASNNQMVYNKFSTAWDTADDLINDLSQNLAQTPLIKGLNQPDWSSLNTQGDTILSGAEAMVQSLNAQYDGSYIFNGSDTKNPPFAIETQGDMHYLTYRGVRVDDPVTLKQPYQDEAGNQVLKADGTAMTNEEMLAQWSNEHLYVDVGIGFEVDGTGNVVDSTAFDSAISGIDFIGGYGVDENGDPKNIVSIMLRAAEVFKDYNEDTGEWGSVGNLEDAKNLVDKFSQAQSALSNQHVALETQAKYLQTNQTQLESTFYSLNTELNSVEKIDEVEAILTLVSAQTSYNAALQVGANVVPQSLMDYLS